MKNIYPNIATEASERSPYGRLRKSIDTVKDAVQIEAVAAKYGEFRMAGNGRLVGRCVSPDHEDRTPSMTLYTDSQQFRCYGCQEYGDVIDLVRLVEGGEPWEVMLILADRHHVALPERPASWHRKQSRQQKIRDRIDAEKIEHIRLLVFRMIWMPWLARLPESVRQEATDSAWGMSRSMALSMYERGREAQHGR